MVAVYGAVDKTMLTVQTPLDEASVRSAPLGFVGFSGLAQHARIETLRHQNRIVADGGCGVATGRHMIW